MVHSDIQARFPDYHVVLARPIAVNLGRLADAALKAIGTSVFALSDLEKFAIPPHVRGKRKAKLEKAIQDKVQEVLEPGIGDTLKVLGYASVNATAAVQEVIGQLSRLQFEGMVAADPAEAPNSTPPNIRFGNLVAYDPAEIDRRLGVCSFPLYSFSEKQAETVQIGGSLDEIRAILRERDIFQYFFPSADQVALGLIERESLKRDGLLTRVAQSPSIGHPLGRLELVPSVRRLTR